MVAYGDTLRKSCRPGWEHAYVNYEQLKDILEQIEALGGGEGENENENEHVTYDNENEKTLLLSTTSTSSSAKEEDQQRLEDQQLEEEEQQQQQQQQQLLEEEQPEPITEEEQVLQLEQTFLLLLRKEVEKVSLFCLSRQGEIAEAVGQLKFQDHPQWPLTIVPRTLPVATKLGESSSQEDEEDNEEEEEEEEEEEDNTANMISQHLGEDAALLPSGTLIKGPLKTPKHSNQHRKTTTTTTTTTATNTSTSTTTRGRKSTPSRPLFKARQSLQESYTQSTHRADHYTEQGVELLHLLRFICVNAMAFRKILKKHNKIMMQWRTNAANQKHAYHAKEKAKDRKGHHRRRTSSSSNNNNNNNNNSSGFLSSFLHNNNHVHNSIITLLGGPEDHLQQLANSASVAAIHSSLKQALQEGPISIHYIPRIRLQCTCASIQVLREYAERMEQTFQGFLSQRAMINTGHNMGGLSYATQQSLQLIVRFQPDVLLLMNNAELYQWHQRVYGDRTTIIKEQDNNMRHPGQIIFREQLLEEKYKSWGGVNSPTMVLNLMSALLYTVNYYCIAPTANHYAMLLHVDGAFGSTLIGVSSLAAIFAALLYSFWYSNGRFKSALICSAICPVIGNLLYATAISFQSMKMALFGRWLVGFGSAEVVNRQLISACVSFRHMTSASALFVAASAIGMSLGPLLAAILDMTAGRDKLVDLKLPYVPAGGIIFDHVTSPGFVMATLWFIELLGLIIFFQEPERVNAPSNNNNDSGGESTPTSTLPTSIREATLTSSGELRQLTNQYYTEYGTVMAASPSRSSKSNSKDENQGNNGHSSKGMLGELIMVKNLVFENVALPITMLLFGYIEMVDEVLISSCSMICRRYFNWHGSRAGILLASLGALVLPAHYFVEVASHHYEERAIMKYSVVFIFFGLFAILNYEGLVFDIIWYAIEAVKPDDFPRNGTISNSTNSTDISVGGQSLTSFVNIYNEIPYDWGAGLIVYITFLSAIFMGTIILEGVDTSLMAQKTPPALNDTFINSGLLATLVGTLGRVIGDSIITFSALIDVDIFVDFVNATFFPLIPLALIGYILVLWNYRRFVSEKED